MFQDHLGRMGDQDLQAHLVLKDHGKRSSRERPGKVDARAGRGIKE